MKSLDKQDWKKRFEKQLGKSREGTVFFSDESEKEVKSFIQSELDRQRKEFSDIVDNGFDKDFGTYDYKQIATEFIVKLQSLLKGETNG